MLGSVTGRRANAFARALDEQAPGDPGAGGGTAADPIPDLAPAPPEHSTPEETAERTTLLALADGLRALPRPAMSAETKTVQRARLVAAMEAMESSPGGERVPGLPDQRDGRRGSHRVTPAHALARLRPRSRLTKGLTAGGLTVGVAAGAFGGVAAASTDALPGDTLYGLKRGIEDFRLDLARGDADRGKIYLDHASTRLNEARRLMERQKAGDLDTEQVAEVRTALASMHGDAAEGHRLLSESYERDGELGPMLTLSSFHDRHGTTWHELRGKLPPELSDVSEDVSELFDAIADDLEPLQDVLPRRADDRPPVPAQPGEGATGAGPLTESPYPAEPSPSGSGPSPEASAEGDAGAGEPSVSSPSAETGTPDGDSGLLGGGGLLDPGLDTGSGEEDTGEATESPGTGEETQSPEPDVTIPPLIDGLLPSLGLDITPDD
ncbi:DUF5667 domain-containing protein [Streptomyces aidingensis]|uniref:DUF5667 domain-containing protein n=1 Tax=Streptomyces aidingensis TaxID=910347 RepID=A0A1I1VIW5_9ACTN|nr:DUF5667 domain-containing protein [Streptomyces aidingensis]SFD80410.1 hypothetical protein SAMN05421773_1335 [Streptomyces aidingensis]